MRSNDARERASSHRTAAHREPEPPADSPGRPAAPPTNRTPSAAVAEHNPQSMTAARLAALLRRVADRLDPQPPTTLFYMRGAYWDGRTFVLCDPSVMLYASSN